MIENHVQHMPHLMIMPFTHKVKCPFRTKESAGQMLLSNQRH